MNSELLEVLKLIGNILNPSNVGHCLELIQKIIALVESVKHPQPQVQQPNENNPTQNGSV